MLALACLVLAAIAFQKSHAYDSLLCWWHGYDGCLCQDCRLVFLGSAELPEDQILTPKGWWPRTFVIQCLLVLSVGLALFAAFGYPVFVAIARMPIYRRASIRGDACQSCGYPRLGLPLGAPCPECGEHFKPD